MFEVIIVSPVFEGKGRLARHKLVNETLKEEISKVHAFTQVRTKWFFLTSVYLFIFNKIETIYTRRVGKDQIKNMLIKSRKYRMIS